MHLLITNDDGIESKGLEILVEWAKTIGQPVVIIPKSHCSGKSHAINFIEPFEVKKVSDYHGVPTYIVDSTPADCVRIGICLYHLPCDMVLSGINLGINVGIDTLYSGTCAAVAEGAALGYPGIAFSVFPDSLDDLKEQLEQTWSYLRQKGILEKVKHLNINFPKNPEGFAFTKFGGPYIRDHFEETDSNIFMARGYSVYEPAQNCDDDLHAVMNHLISISPMTIDKTDYEELRWLKQLK